jgi:hypothetical protein
MDCQRVSAGVRCDRTGVRTARRLLRPQAFRDCRSHYLHGGVGALRRCERHAVSRDRARPARRRRRHDGGHGVRVDTGPLPRSAGAGALAGRAGRRVRHRHRRRSVAGRLDERALGLALDLPDQPAGRRRGALFHLGAPAFIPAPARRRSEDRLARRGAGRGGAGRPAGAHRSRAQTRPDRWDAHPGGLRDRRYDCLTGVRKARHASDHSRNS